MFWSVSQPFWTVKSLDKARMMERQAAAQKRRAGKLGKSLNKAYNRTLVGKKNLKTVYRIVGGL